MNSREFEKLCREKFGKMFNTTFEERKFSEKIPKKFDMVSNDNEIVGDAKYLTMVQGKKRPSAKISNISEYVWLLEKCPAKTRFAVFGNDRKVPELWLETYGALLKDEEGNPSIKFYFLDHDTMEIEKLNFQ